MTKILVYEDNEDLRDGLAQMLRNTPDLDVVASFANCNNAKDDVEIHQPEVILMDIDMPGVNGIEGTRIIKNNFPEVQILMLTVFEAEEKIFEAICAGANGYLLKLSAPEKIVVAIKEVLEGGVPITSSIARKVLGFFPGSGKKNDFDNLSPRETEILNGLVKGLSYKLLAAELKISIDTVRSHIKKVYEKLHVNSATEAISKAMRNKQIK